MTAAAAAGRGEAGAAAPVAAGALGGAPAVAPQLVATAGSTAAWQRLAPSREADVAAVARALANLSSPPTRPPGTGASQQLHATTGKSSVAAPPVLLENRAVVGLCLDIMRHAYRLDDVFSLTLLILRYCAQGLRVVWLLRNAQRAQEQLLAVEDTKIIMPGYGSFKTT